MQRSITTWRPACRARSAAAAWTTPSCSQMAFAIPGTLASRIVAAAIEGKPLAFSKLGIQMTAVKDGTKWRMAVKDVSEPAKAAGIQKHDIILAIEDTEILDAAHLKNYLIERTVPGQRVSVKVRRAEADLTFTVTLAGGLGADGTGTVLDPQSPTSVRPGGSNRR